MICWFQEGRLGVYVYSLVEVRIQDAVHQVPLQPYSVADVYCHMWDDSSTRPE